jgi:hypothetical protein
LENVLIAIKHITNTKPIKRKHGNDQLQIGIVSFDNCRFFENLTQNLSPKTKKEVLILKTCQIGFEIYN